MNNLLYDIQILFESILKCFKEFCNRRKSIKFEEFKLKKLPPHDESKSRFENANSPATEWQRDWNGKTELRVNNPLGSTFTYES